MIKVEINDKEYQLPESWDEVKLDRYINCLKVIEKQPEFGSMTAKVIDQIVAISPDQPGLKDDVMGLPMVYLGEFLKEFEWLTETPDYKKYSKDEIIEVDGQKYILKQEYAKLTANEMITMEELLASNKFDIHHLEIAFGILCRPLDENGKEKPLTMETFKEVVINLQSKFYLKDIFPIIGFFLDGDTNSITSNSQSSSPVLKITRGNSQSKKKRMAKKA